MLKGIKRLGSLIKDFFKIILGLDYFHQPQPLGRYFQDERSYYNDLRKKSEWKGKFKDSVPVLYLSSEKKHVFLPVMVLQYGLGSIDMFFQTGEDRYLRNVRDVFSWITENINPGYYFDNLTPDSNRDGYYSPNSAMAQGQALSFLIRAEKYDLIGKKEVNTEEIIDGIFFNMIKPLPEEGTVIEEEEDIYFCELCKKDNYIVLNGWIFAVFGLFDYRNYADEDIAGKYLSATLKTLKKDLKDYELGDGWSYYDNKGRTSSPFYQSLHISLFEALYRLTEEEDFKEFAQKMKKGFSSFKNKIKYTMVKVKDRLNG